MLGDRIMSRKRFILTIGYVLATGFTLLLFYLFLQAYLNGMDHIIRINDYNEANIELIIFPVIIFIILLGLFYTLKDVKDEDVADGVDKI